MSSVLVSQEQDFPRWYQEVIAKAQLAENGPVRGTMVIRPWGYSIWERLQAAIDERIKATGARNAYFPLLIPEAYLRREAEHVEGFSPELAVVTHGGGKELEEPAVVRPTSETIVNSSFARWISSYRDLPLLINQWANVVRWELRPRLFLRTSEFLWQEGHTAHATRAQAHEYALRILAEVYTDAMVEELAIPVFQGRKTEREKFAGAEISWSCEGAMRDGKALQMGTSHELGQNFARAFNIQYSDRDGQLRHVWQTSWGASTRLIGAMIMVHGDDHGLRVPPRLAPVQVVVLVARAGEGVAEAATTLVDALERVGVRAELDDSVEVSLGRRIVDHELRGVPIRLELGPRDLAANQVVIARRCPGGEGDGRAAGRRPRGSENARRGPARPSRAGERAPRPAHPAGPIDRRGARARGRRLRPARVARLRDRGRGPARPGRRVGALSDARGRRARRRSRR